MTKPPLLVDIVADIVCPWCYVGVRSFNETKKSLAADFDVAARYRPYELNPGLPLIGVDRHAYYTRKFSDSAKLAAARDAIRENARLSGFDFDPSAPPHLPNTVKAHQIIRLAHFAGVQEQATLAIYRAFWDEMADISDEARLIAIAASCGVDEGLAAAALGAREDAAMVEAEAESFRAAGVAGVPTFIVNERTGFSGGMPPAQLEAALRQAARMSAGSAA